MSDGPSRFDGDESLVKRPEFKLKEEQAVLRPESNDGSSSKNGALAPLSDPQPVYSHLDADRTALSEGLSAALPASPVAPKYAGLPFPLVLICLVFSIAAVCSWLEPMRAQAVVNILDTKGVNAPDFVDAHINLAEALFRNGAHTTADKGLKVALAMVEKSVPLDPEKKVALLLRLAQSQYDGDSRIEAEQTLNQALSMLNERAIPTVNISVCWQLDGLANTIVKLKGNRHANRALAIKVWQKGIRYFRSPNPVLVANLYGGMGTAQMNNDEYAKAAASFMKFHELTEIRGDRVWRIYKLRDAAYCYDCLKDYPNSKKAATLAIEMCQRLNTDNDGDLPYCQYLLGAAENQLGLSKQGIVHLNQALPSLKRSYPDNASYTYALWYLANCYRDSGDINSALKTYSLCLSETERTGSGPYTADVQRDRNKIAR